MASMIESGGAARAEERGHATNRDPEHACSRQPHAAWPARRRRASRRPFSPRM